MEGNLNGCGFGIWIEQCEAGKKVLVICNMAEEDKADWGFLQWKKGRLSDSGSSSKENVPGNPGTIGFDFQSSDQDLGPSWSAN